MKHSVSWGAACLGAALMTGEAQALEVCVNDGAQLSDVGSCVPGGSPGLNCEGGGPFATIEEALAAIAADEVDNPGGENWICMIHASILQPAATIVVDNSAGAYGDRVTLSFLSERSDGAPPTSMCPPLDGSTAFQFDGPVDLKYLVSEWHGAGCDEAAGDRGTWVEVGPDGDVVLLEVVLEAARGTSPVLRVLGGGDLVVNQSRISDGDGPALDGEGNVTLFHTDLSLLAPPRGAPVVQVTGTLTLDNASIASNYVRDAPLVDVRAAPELGAGRPLTVDRSVVVGNAVGDDEPVLALTLPPGDGEPRRSWVYASEIARNQRWTDSPALSMPPRMDRIPRPCVQDSDCMPCGAGEHVDYQDPDQVAALVGGVPGSAPLVRVEADSLDRRGSIDFLKNFLVDNPSAGGALLGVVGDDPSKLTVSFVHNTIANGDAPPLDQTGTTGVEHLISARNLVFGATSATASPPSHAERVLDVFQSAAPSWEALFEGGLEGPLAPPFTTDSRLPSFHGEGCEAVPHFCPNITATNCFDGQSEAAMVCLADAGRDYRPSDALLATYQVEWPWTALLLDSAAPASDGANAPGATGHDCLNAGDLEFPSDRTDFSGSGSAGDGDGFTTLTDCENEDDGVVPELPELDGYTTEACEPAECYECPAEPAPWASGTDDDDTTDDDDDDDDDATDDDDVSEFESCSAKGCATPFGGAMFPIALLALRRRSRSDGHDS